MKYFLMKFDRPSGSLEVSEFATASAAMDRRVELEQSRASRSVEIVVIGAGSLDDVRKTHARYFRLERPVTTPDLPPPAAASSDRLYRVDRALTRAIA